MLHNFCSDSAPAHVRDFYMARLFRTPAHATAPEQTTSSTPSENAAEYEPTQDASVPGSPQNLPLPQPADPNLSPLATASSQSLPGTPMRPRPRGGDGRFVPRAEEYSTPNNRYSKICGWCHTTSTSQWRVGPTSGSVEMGTLCNACGINYRRALAKTPDSVLNLDKLAQQMGHTRLSIQKALKRQRKLSATPTQMKRTRSEAGGVPRKALQLGLAQSMMDVATTSSVTTWEEHSSHFSPGVAGRTSATSPQNESPGPKSRVPLALSVGLPVPRAFGNSAQPMTASSGSGRSAPQPVPPRNSTGVAENGVGGESATGRKVGSWKSGCDSVTLSPEHSERSVPSRLPPFQSFLGSIEKQPRVL